MPPCNNDYLPYDFFGSHKNGDGFVFRVLAPHADEVFLVGDFCGWEKGLPMRMIGSGIWEYCLPVDSCFGEYSNYKYRIEQDGKVLYKSDPYALHFELHPATASKFYDIEDFEWKDNGWLKRREKKTDIKAYPVDLLRQIEGGELKTASLPIKLASSAKRMGYSHIRLSPIMERSNLSEKDYGIYGYFAPSSRLGTPKDFMNLINELHRSGVGVLLDIPISHLSHEEQGLLLFDGERLYETYDSNDNAIFDLKKKEICNFLISSADFWIRKYHVDGICICGTDEKNDFMKKLHSHISSEFSEIIIVTCEE